MGGVGEETVDGVHLHQVRREIVMDELIDDGAAGELVGAVLGSGSGIGLRDAAAHEDGYGACALVQV